MQLERNNITSLTEHMIEAATLLFRCGEILFSRKQVASGIALYSGIDPKERPSSDFFSRCTSALKILYEIDRRRYDLFVRYIGRIIGSEAPTRFWSFPRILELNYNLVFLNDAAEIASVIVGETAVARFWKFRRIRYTNPERFYHMCLRDEILFRERIRRDKLSAIEKLMLLRSKSWLWENHKAQLQRKNGGVH